MYEAVHAHPDGDSTVARLARTAGEYGYDGVVVRNRSDARPDYDADRIGDEYGVDVVDGLEIRADGPEQASGYVGNYRRDVTVLLLEGGTPELNRFAVEQPRVDVLARPMAGDGDFNHVLAKAARENGVRVEFDFSPVLGLTGGPRVQALSDMRKLREVVDQYDAPYVVSANPYSHLQLRAPRELIAVGELVGFSREWMADGLREWHRLAERNRERQSESFIEPGVKRGTYEKEP
ncbi:RNase P subunit p30 family protein [Halostella pelagica]|uniref:RNase P subunit p30 family protein n=1 Tax=Halostella pelagica TaxID=2583824 RepID=UPI00108215F2|nr:RNase P subunit p30 family protein [Halostella pelagica]